MSKMRIPPNLKGLDDFASKAAMVPVSSEPVKTPSEPQSQNRREDDVGEKSHEKGGEEKKVIQPLIIESQKPLATSLYFFDEDRNRLDAIIGKIKEFAPSKKKISVSLVLRGLLLMAEKADPKEVVAAIKEVSF